MSYATFCRNGKGDWSFIDIIEIPVHKVCPYRKPEEIIESWNRISGIMEDIPAPFSWKYILLETWYE